MAIIFMLNGHTVHLDVNPETPLLWVLRDAVGLKGTKYGCGMALCGACTVHVNRKATRSCITTVAQVEGKDVRTIEGLAPENNHPLQRAWREIDVPQCGYCQAGQIMSAAALLLTHPQPSDDEISQAMAGNICRCGTYLRIRQAIHRAVEISKDGSRGKVPQTRSPRS
jgi:isoquinoline 1-oxidoreductase alpha subunit